MTFFAPFCIPFMVGAAVMFVVLLWKWGSWLYLLPRADKKRILFGLPTRRTFGAAWELLSASLAAFSSIEAALSNWPSCA